MERQRGVITVAETLAGNRVGLELTARDAKEAMVSVLELLRGDPRVLDWERLHNVASQSATCLGESNDAFGICIPHARTDAVSSMVMSAGRFRDGVIFPRCAQPIRYIFCIAVPVALASDYLRIVGVLARIQRSPATESRLWQAASTAEFVDALADLEASGAVD
jgi:mannitol/fructose-specific phosphotransferase system IIA component (Ntr-type)